MPPLLLRAVGLVTRRVTACTGAALLRGALEARSGPSHCPLSLSCGTAALAPSVRRVSTLLSDTRRAGSLRIRTRTLSVRAESTPNGVGKRKAPKAPKHLGVRPSWLQGFHGQRTTRNRYPASTLPLLVVTWNV